MKSKQKYSSVTANINDDGSVQILAWYRSNRRLSFDMIPLRGKEGKIVTKVIES